MTAADLLGRVDRESAAAVVVLGYLLFGHDWLVGAVSPTAASVVTGAIVAGAVVLILADLRVLYRQYRSEE